ncbi:MAG: 5-(carboxyamino)imidazole ribonucleotide mutase [Ruminococcus sp.]|jgi:5-(carboxyamino)imidazole ribonucleotide mutase|nr:5-(carboxyamino)imidazole ribonucleotide mutase [Ruminococcus sp.]
MSKKIAVIMGSDSDLPIAEQAIAIFREFGIDYEAHVYSAHRTPEVATAFARSAFANGFGVIICAAGMSAHLAGVIAANTTLPVIGIPIKSTLEGFDALLSTVMMPPGVPVATVGINGGKNAALLAIQILAVSDDELASYLETYKFKMEADVLAKDKAIAEKLKEM